MKMTGIAAGAQRVLFLSLLHEKYSVIVIISPLSHIIRHRSKVVISAFFS